MSSNKVETEQSYMGQPEQRYWKGKYYPVRKEKRFPYTTAIIAITLCVIFAVVGIGLSTNWSFFNLFSPTGGQSVAYVPSTPAPSEPINTIPEIESPPPIDSQPTETLPMPEIPQTPQTETNFSEEPYQPNGQESDNLVAGKPEIVVSDFEQQIHSLINRERQNNLLPALSWDERLSTIARKHSEDMASRNYFDHTTPEGIGLSERYRQDGYILIVGCGENIFKCPMAKVYWYHNQVLSQVQYYERDEMANVIVQGWMDSPGHRANILNPSWNCEGIGVTISNDDIVYITEDFA